MSKRTLIGKPVARVDAVAKVTGGAQYGVDLQFPGMLVGRILRAGVPHARITHIDTSEARHVPGVRAVITGRDFDRRHGPLMKDQPALTLLAKQVAPRPVRIVFDREDEFLTSPGRLPARITMKTAVDRKGQLLARQATVYWNKGAYLDLGATVARNSGYVALGPYKIPNASVDSYVLYTNRQPGGAFRGLGVPQMAWAGEQQLDRVARELDMSPIDLRRNNLLDEGDVSITGETMHTVGAKACLKAVVDRLESPHVAAASGADTQSS